MVATMDLQKFFDNVHHARVEQVLLRTAVPRKLVPIIHRLVTRKDALPQGAPTSTFLGNVVLRSLDRRIANFARRHHVAYTRYVDDLALSADYDFSLLLPNVEDYVLQSGFKLSRSKTIIAVQPDEQIITKSITVNKRISLSSPFRERLLGDIALLRRIEIGRSGRREIRELVDSVQGRVSYARYVNREESAELVRLYREALAQSGVSIQPARRKNR